MHASTCTEYKTGTNLSSTMLMWGNLQLISITPTFQRIEMRVLHAVVIKIITTIGIKQKGYALILKLIAVKHIHEKFITSKEI